MSSLSFFDGFAFAAGQFAFAVLAVAAMTGVVAVVYFIYERTKQ